jgi:hypothetical protein
VRIRLPPSQYVDFRDTAGCLCPLEDGVIIVDASVANRHVVSFPFGGQFRKLLVEPEGLARKGFEG